MTWYLLDDFAQGLSLIIAVSKKHLTWVVWFLHEPGFVATTRIVQIPAQGRRQREERADISFASFAFQGALEQTPEQWHWKYTSVLF